MEFIKVGKNYLIKGSNGRIVSEKEKLQLENNELTIKNEDCGCACPDKIKKIQKNKKKIKKIEEKEYKNPYVNNSTVKDELYEDEDGNKIVKRDVKIEETAQKEVDADDIIKETNNTL